MQLTPGEFDKLLICMLADVALKRKETGIELNYPEAVASVSATATDGARTGETIEDGDQGGARSASQGGCHGERCGPHRIRPGGGRIYGRQPPRDRVLTRSMDPASGVHL